VLVGAFVFAADLARSLACEGLPLGIEFLWLRSYGPWPKRRRSTHPRCRHANVRDRHVLLVDGVLDQGDARQGARLAEAAGAASVTTAVAVDKRRANALLVADHAAFTNVEGFVVGYSMDDGETGRALPYIGRMRPPST
jgi:hypoxanthine phosphoribosyltransferase